jgi:RHS repeat-associated protein
LRPATTHTTNSIHAFLRYRFHFNGKETDNEVYGEGNVYDYGFRIYNPRLGKFLSVDPLTKEYPWYTPYQFAGNKPIWAMDRDGLEEWYSNTGSSLPAHLFKESNAHVSDIKPVAFGPFSPEYAESEGLSSMPVLNLPEIVVTPSTSFVPELLTPRNNDYSPFIPTASDVEAAASAVGLGGTGVTVIGVLVTPILPEVGIPLIEAGQTINNIADLTAAAADISQGDMQGLATKAVFKTADYSLGKILDLSPLGEADNATQKAIWGTITNIGENKTEEANKDTTTIDKK